MKRYGVVPERFNGKKEPIGCYAADRAYWRLFWWRAANRAAKDGAALGNM